MSATYIVHSWPKAIAHIDGDAFFASVEQAVKPWLRGKPVVTGKERNIVAAASYEAKRFGVKRGVALWDAKKMCPDLVVLPTDYETVSIFSKRMYAIMRRYTPAVEEYSVDEGFIDLTGLRRLHRGNYMTIAARLQEDIHRELGITVTVGLSVSKVLTKVASSLGKPAGFVAISAREREEYLKDYAIGDVWGVGANTEALLKGHGMQTALAFAQRSRDDIAKLLTKPGIEVWEELNGNSVLPIETAPKEAYQTISKVKTFTPSSNDKEYVYAQLFKNLENACIKARRYDQAPKRIAVFLKRHDHRAFGLDAKLNRPSAFPSDLIPIIKNLFDDLFQSGTSYRATGIILGDLVEARPTQPSLFENPLEILKKRKVYAAIDDLRERFGKHAVHHGVSLPAQRTQHLTVRGDMPMRKTIILKGETKRRRLPLPMLQASAR
jgi:DNA polymerase-4/DNA polymerase V